MRKFPSIEQFRHVVESVVARATYLGRDDHDEPVFQPELPKPVLTFRGTVKLHGSNCGVEFDLARQTVSAQSRERDLTVADDNFGFCAWTQSASGAADLFVLRREAERLCERTLPKVPVALVAYGEWCGPLVNGKTGIGKLPLRWVVFGILALFADGDEAWLDMEAFGEQWAACRAALGGSAPKDVFVITNYPMYSITIDFNAPETALDELERLTLEVEASCPVAKAMGGDGIGEGIVWSLRDMKYGYQVFKTKGAKHKGTKGQRLVNIAPEVLAGREAFADAVVTESRLEQGFDLLRARYGKVAIEHLGDFLMWVGQDVLKEESDTLAASGLTKKDVMSTVNARAKAWLLPRLAQV